jgi:hypothetical protein
LRRDAQWDLDEAIRAGADLGTINKLRAALAAAKYDEDVAIGKRR